MIMFIRYAMLNHYRVIMLTFVRDLMTLLNLLVGTFLHGGVGALRSSVCLLAFLLIHSGADRLAVVITDLVVLSVANTLGNLAAVVVVLGLIPEMFVEFFDFAFFY